MTTIKIKILSDNPEDRSLLVPRQQTEGAAGYDLVASQDMTLTSGVPALVKCGFAMELPPGWEAQVRPRSSMLLKHRIHVAFGTIDADYRGEVGVVMMYLGVGVHYVKRGDRVAQMVVAPVHAAKLLVASTLNDTARGASGFGSTGTSVRTPQMDTLNSGTDS